MTDLDQRIAHTAAPWLDGNQSAALTLAHAALIAGSADATIASLHRLSSAEPRLAALAEQAALRAHGLDRVCRLLATVDHDGAQDPSAIGAMFDHAVAIDEICSVAIYALGDATLLDDATQEIVAALRGWNLLHPTTRVLEIGCGTGRFATSLAPFVLSYHGLDVSAGMVERARIHTAHLANVRIDPSDGRGLAGVASATVDLVLAIDVAPYWQQAGDAVVTSMLAESRRVLVPAGTLLVLGWSYRDTDDVVRRDATARAALHGFVDADPAPVRFCTWDAPAFRFRVPRA